MLCFTTEGSAFERGRQQGEACRELARPWIEKLLSQMTEKRKAASRQQVISDVRPQLEAWKTRISTAAPELVEECEGIAAGLGMTENEYFAAVYGLWLLDGWVDPYGAPTGPQCTTVGFRDDRGRAILSKTDDIYKEELGLNVLETTRPDVGYAHAHFHFAGTIYTVAGMNEHGLAMGMTGIPGPKLDGEGLPSLDMLHTVLPGCATVPEALEYIKGLRMNYGGFSLLLGDASGEIVSIEKTGAGMAVLDALPDGFLLHTNQTLDPDLADKNPEQTEPLLTNSRRRYENALQMTQDLARTESGAREFLANDSKPGAIWQDGDAGLHTDFGAILIPAEKRISYWTESPAGAEQQNLILN